MSNIPFNVAHVEIAMEADEGIVQAEITIPDQAQAQVGSEDDKILEAYIRNVRKLIMVKLPQQITHQTILENIHQETIKAVSKMFPDFGFVEIDDLSSDEPEIQNDPVVQLDVQKILKIHLKNEIQVYNNIVKEKGQKFVQTMFQNLRQQIQTEFNTTNSLRHYPQLEFIVIVQSIVNDSEIPPVWQKLIVDRLMLEAHVFCGPINTAIVESRHYKISLDNAIKSQYCLTKSQLDNYSQSIIQETFTRSDFSLSKLAKRLFDQSVSLIFESAQQENQIKLNLEEECIQSANAITIEKYHEFMTKFIQTTLLTHRNLVEIHERFVNILVQSFTNFKMTKNPNVWEKAAQNLKIQLNQLFEISLEKNQDRFLQLKKLKKSSFSSAEKELQRVLNSKTIPSSSEILSKYIPTTIISDFEGKIKEVPENVRINWVCQLTVKISKILATHEPQFDDDESFKNMTSASSSSAFNSPRIVRQRTLERPQRNHNLAIYFNAKAVRVGVLNDNGNFQVLLKDCPDLLPYIYLSSSQSSSTRPLLLYGRSAADLRHEHEDGFVNLYEILLSPQQVQRFTKQFTLNDVTFNLKIEHLLALYFHHLKRLISLAIECTSADLNPIVLVTTPYIFMSSKQMLKNALKMSGLEEAKILQSTTAMAMTFFCGFDFTRTDSTVDRNQTTQEIPLILVHRTKKDIVMATATVSKNIIEMKMLDHCFSTLVNNNDKLDTRSGLPLKVMSELRSLAVDKKFHVFMVTESNCQLESKSVKSIFTENCSTRRIDEVDEFDGILRGACALYSMSHESSGCIPPYVEICPFEIFNREIKGRFNIGINEYQYSELFSLHCPFKKTRDECRPNPLNLCEGWLDKNVVDIGTFKANTGSILRSPPVNFKIVLTDEGLIAVTAVLSNGSPVDVKAETVYMQPNEVDESSEKLGPIFEFQKTLFTKSDKGIDSGNIDCSRQPMDRARGNLDGTSKSKGDNDLKKDGARDRLRALVEQVQSKINTEVGASTNRLILQKVKEHIYASNTLVAKVGSSDVELEMQYEILEKAAVRIKS